MGVNLTGGRTKDGGSIVGGSVFYSKPSSPKENSLDVSSEDSEPHITQLEEELKVSIFVVIKRLNCVLTKS